MTAIGGIRGAEIEQKGLMDNSVVIVGGGGITGLNDSGKITIKKKHNV